MTNSGVNRIFRSFYSMPAIRVHMSSIPASGSPSWLISGRTNARRYSILDGSCSKGSQIRQCLMANASARGAKLVGREDESSPASIQADVVSHSQ
jgi:hypothetical protein